MADPDQLREPGEQLRAAPPAPADQLAKLPEFMCCNRQEEVAVPLTSGRLSHSSGPLNGSGSLSTSPLVSPEIDEKDPAEADKLMKIQRDLDETKIILHKTIESVLARGESLNSLVKKSSDMSAASQIFSGDGGGGMEEEEEQIIKGDDVIVELEASLEGFVHGWFLKGKAAECLHGIEQSPGSSVMEAIQPSLKAVTREELLKHEDEDVKVFLATCFYEITRITAPDAPYNDDILRDIFYLIVGTFRGLSDVNGQSFGRRVSILEAVARCRACVVMLDLECDDLITEMFRTFLDVVSGSHEQNIVTSIQTIMTLIIDESEDIQDSLLCVLFSALRRKKTVISMLQLLITRMLQCLLALSTIEHSIGKLELYMKKFLTSCLAGDVNSPNDQIDHLGSILDLY
ncbi:hypothetical protein ACP4OV_012298 [Aristida adscensionis]